MPDLPLQPPMARAASSALPAAQPAAPLTPPPAAPLQPPAAAAPQVDPLQAGVIALMRRNFNALSPAERQRLAKLIDPETVRAVAMLLGPQVAEFLQQYERRQRVSIRPSAVQPLTPPR